MPINDYSIISNQYASLDNSGTAFLAFKQIPDLLKRHAIGKKALDYGCGSGSSTLFLNEIGLDVEGVDISQDMLQEARQLNIKIPFNLIESAKLGAHVATIPPAVIRQLFHHPLTEKGLAAFLADWEKTKQAIV